MEKSLKELLQEVERARLEFLGATNGLSVNQASWKPDDQTWSVIDNVEHLFWAELGGINGMWKTFEAVRRNQPVYTGEVIHEGLPIEKIVEMTWKPKEQVPEIARPRWGGSLSYWVAALSNLQLLLTNLTDAIGGADLKKIIHPHPISGPINIIQRFEFLRFHMNRHQKQIENLKKHPGFPKE